MKHILLFLFLSLILLSGCSPRINTDAMKQNRYDFNSAVIRSWDEQMLLNLVRMRYRDNPLFLEVGNVVASQSTKISGSLGGEVDFAPQNTGAAVVGAGREITLAPTVTYAPLQGEDFAKRMLSPIPPSTIFLLSQSGWSLERLLLCCVQTMNDVPNAVSASGPTPDFVPTYESFRDLSNAFRIVQRANGLQLTMNKDGQSLLLTFRNTGAPNVDSAVSAIRTILRLSTDDSIYIVSPNSIRNSGNEIALTGRSLLSVMYFLSQSVHVPEAHEKMGIVTVTRDEKGNRFNWDAVIGNVMTVHSSAAPPELAAVKIPYRGAWFYIADTDLTSKTTFTLLSFLFNLQAANKSGADPVLTYPVR